MEFERLTFYETYEPDAFGHFKAHDRGVDRGGLRLIGLGNDARERRHLHDSGIFAETGADVRSRFCFAHRNALLFGACYRIDLCRDGKRVQVFDRECRYFFYFTLVVVAVDSVMKRLRGFVNIDALRRARNETDQRIGFWSELFETNYIELVLSRM